ncbi:hypothetical protein CR513_18499, partial [Mucuna pruriens]
MAISIVAEDFKIERKNGTLGIERDSRIYGFLGEGVPICGTVELDTIFGEGSNAKMIPILYTVIEAEASYNIIMGRSALNRLKAVVSTYHLCMKYPTTEGVGAVWADSSMAKRVGQRKSVVNALSLELDPRCHEERERPHPVEKLKEIQVGPLESQRTKIGTTMTGEQEAELIRYFDVFAWAPKDMPGIDPKFMNHRLSIADGAQPVVQKKRKQGEEKRRAIRDETDKLLKAGFIREVRYPE